MYMYSQNPTALTQKMIRKRENEGYEEEDYINPKNK